MSDVSASRYTISNKTNIILHVPFLYESVLMVD